MLGFSDAPQAFTVAELDEQSWVALPDVAERPRSVSDAMVETLVAWGVDTVFGMVGHSNLGFAEALRRAEERGEPAPRRLTSQTSTTWLRCLKSGCWPWWPTTKAATA